MTYDHQSQYQLGASDITRKAGCTWTSVANGIAAISGGSAQPSPDKIHSLVARNEETNAVTPGWSIPDAVLAASRFGVWLQNRTGQGFDALTAAHASGHYILAQGDSDRFGNNTCSGNFDGDHCIGIHPRTKVQDGIEYWWIDDPICPTGRWERKSIIRAYCIKLSSTVRFAVFLQPVPQSSWQAKVPAGVALRLFTVGKTAAHPNGQIIEVHIRSKPWTRIDKPCSAPHKYPWPGHTSRTLVKLKDGPWILARYAKENS